MGKRKKPQETQRLNVISQLRQQLKFAEAPNTEIGLPLPGLCLSYLLDSTSFLLGRVWQLAGPPSSGKSTLSAEIGRWHLLYPGANVIYNSNENKDEDHLRTAILMHRQDLLDRFGVPPVTTDLQSWQTNVTKSFQIAREYQTTHNDFSSPVAVIVDSVTGTGDRDAIAKILEAGHATLTYPAIPRLVAEWLRAMPQLMANMPYSLILVNHVQTVIDANRPAYLPALKTTKGGEHLKYATAMRLDIERTQKLNVGGYTGFQVRITCGKNSHGVQDRSILVDLLVWDEAVPEADGGGVQRMAAWDWDSASIYLLLALRETNKTAWNAVRDLLGLRIERDLKNRNAILAAEHLGIPSDSPQHARIVGRALNANQAILAELYKILQIQTKPILAVGSDFREEAEKLREMYSLAVRRMYGIAEELPDA